MVACSVFLFGYAVVDGKKMSGTYYRDAQMLIDTAGNKCRVDSGSGFVMKFEKPDFNELFGDGEKTMLTFYVGMPNAPTAKSIRLPDPDFHIYYQEMGSILLFECYEAQGWIRINKTSKGKLEGSMEVDLINPHHNFSNSDFHHLEGEFRLSPGKVE